MTPLMRQYWDIKAAHEDKILLFRMGDFYEMFFEDAKTAAPIVGIALTQRNKKSEDETPMCGVPHHSIAGPINKLLKAGLRVAICDQLEDPSTAKGIVKRGVTRVLTPGMVYDPETLVPTQSNYIAAYFQRTLACVDASTGEAFYFSEIDLGELQRLLDVLPVAEFLSDMGREQSAIRFSGLWTFREAKGATAEGALRDYVKSLAGDAATERIKKFEKRNLQQRMDLSKTVLRHLEIFETYKGEGLGSLFHTMDRTRTSGGARLLRQWMLFPLVSEEEIQKRWDLVEGWVLRPSVLRHLRESLGQIGDIERRFAKLSQPQANARDLLSLANSLLGALESLKIAEERSFGLGGEDLTTLKNLALEIERMIVPEPPLTVKQGHIIQSNVLPHLDELIELSTNSQKLLAEMEQREREQTGISSLKIRYNNVFGYYIEVTNTHADKVPARYQRKQTLTNAERFCTPELIELERKVLSAQSKRADLEFEIFEDLRRQVQSHVGILYALAAQISELDVVSSLAWLALERKYVRPKFSNTRRLSIEASRHPVVEVTVKNPFVSNDITVEPRGCVLLTGPNMAGKSTLMRQVALTIIMAQMGSFVAANSAELPLVDHIFTRIGASDQLSEGLSTFMVEMTETAEMIRKCTPKSLLILDEIGRGTSTYDGMSLAQSILEYILTETQAMSFFATHYHELTVLEQNFSQVKNAHMSVAERGGEIKFLHTLKMGPAQKSYGIQVAQLAGLPPQITDRAIQLLKTLEKGKKNGSLMGSLGNEQNARQLSLEDINIHEAAMSGGESAIPPMPHQQELMALLQEMREFDLMRSTPLAAMGKIESWKQRAQELQS